MVQGPTVPSVKLKCWFIDKANVVDLMESQKTDCSVGTMEVGVGYWSRMHCWTALLCTSKPIRLKEARWNAKPCCAWGISSLMYGEFLMFKAAKWLHSSHRAFYACTLWKASIAALSNTAEEYKVVDNFNCLCLPASKPGSRVGFTTL